MIIALEGPDGAGKSTAMRYLTRWARDSGRSVRVVSKWDIFRDGAVPSARFLRASDQRELRTCIAEMSTPARMLFLGWMNADAAARAAGATEDLVLLDGYWAKHAAAELLAGCPQELVDAVSRSVAPVDATVYLDVTPVEALRRKGEDLAPYECGCDPACSPQRFLEHQAAVRTTMLGWAARYGWHVIDAGSEEHVGRRLTSILGTVLADPSDVASPGQVAGVGAQARSS